MTQSFKEQIRDQHCIFIVGDNSDGDYNGNNFITLSQGHGMVREL